MRSGLPLTPIVLACHRLAGRSTLSSETVRLYSLPIVM